MGLSFDPQPIIALSMRVGAALEEVYDQLKVVRGEITRPGFKPKHVFDFVDGIRLIISKEKVPEGVTLIHVSGSRQDHMGTIPMDDPDLAKNVEEAYHHLRSTADVNYKIRPLHLIGLTPRVVHFYGEV